MASVVLSSMKVCDITQCSICLETFKEPKALPCIHTFCLQCLDKHCQNKEQEEVACPLCRKVFAIPPGGNVNLPNNFFILQLLQINQLSQPTDGVKSEAIKKQNVCELCSDSDSEITSYCIECDQRICDRCSAIHTKTKVCRTHQVIREADMPSADERRKVALSYCDQHPSEQNRLYCNDCMKVTCPVCIVNKHKKHELSDVSESAEKFREQLKLDVDSATACALRKLEIKKQLEIDTRLFVEKIAKTQSEISQKYEEIIYLIQSHKSELVEELNVFKDKMLKEAETKKDEIERQFVIAESFKRYCQEMINKGTACDISRTAHDLHARAEELVKITQDEPDCHKLYDVEIVFKPSVSTKDGVKNFIGELTFGDQAPFNSFDFNKSSPVVEIADRIESMSLRATIPSISWPDIAAGTGVSAMRNSERAAAAKISGVCTATKTDSLNGNCQYNLTKFLGRRGLLHVMPDNGNPITGITVLGSEVFVTRSTSQVFVYNCDDFTVMRCFRIMGSNRLSGLVTCSQYNCLYASDSGQCTIYRYNLVDNVAVKWLVPGSCARLSLTNSHTVLVTLFDTNKVQEYSTTGHLISEVKLVDSIDYPQHCVELSDTAFVVCHSGMQKHRVCIVSSGGQIVRSYGESRAGGVRQLNYPAHLIIDALHNVLVADCRNNRVQLLSPTLNYLGDIVIPGHKLNQPYYIHFDELNRRMYIGEMGGGRVFVLETNVSL